MSFMMRCWLCFSELMYLRNIVERGSVVMISVRVVRPHWERYFEMHAKIDVSGTILDFVVFSV
jgi:hypothetical protein